MLLALQRPQHAPVRHRCGGWPTRLSREALGSNGSLRQIVVALADFAPRELPPPADPYLWLRTGTREMGQARVSATPTARVCPRRPAVRPARAVPPPSSARGQHRQLCRCQSAKEAPKRGGQRQRLIDEPLDRVLDAAVQPSGDHRVRRRVTPLVDHGARAAAPFALVAHHPEMKQPRKLPRHEVARTAH
jgi:hypothetical protein